MKFALLPTAFVAALMLTGCNDFNERLLADLTKEKEMVEGVRYYAASSGMNCPVPLKIFQTGETERGLTQRIECQSNDGEKTWNLRMIMRPNGIKQVEAW